MLHRSTLTIRHCGQHDHHRRLRPRRLRLCRPSPSAISSSRAGYRVTDPDPRPRAREGDLSRCPLPTSSRPTYYDPRRPVQASARLRRRHQPRGRAARRARNASFGTRTSSSRASSSTRAAVTGVRRLLHMSALSAAAPDRVRARTCARRAKPKRRAAHRVSTSRSSALRHLRTGGSFPQSVREAHAVFPPCCSSAEPHARFQPVLRRSTSPRCIRRRPSPDSTASARLYDVAGPKVYTLRELVTTSAAIVRYTAAHRGARPDACRICRRASMEWLPGDAADARQPRVDAGRQRLRRVLSLPLRHRADGARGDRARVSRASARRTAASTVPATRSDDAAVAAVRSTRVGGAVRDELLGLPVSDRDWVVVGATPERCSRRGFMPVGKDFPGVPASGDARGIRARAHRAQERPRLSRLRSSTPHPTSRSRRTCAARPHDQRDGARRGRRARSIRSAARTTCAPASCATSAPAFAEDPVRMLRVARFAARFGFASRAETLALMREMVDAGEVDALVPERVWQELARGLMEERPSRMFEVLRECGALARIAPELATAVRTNAEARRQRWTRSTTPQAQASRSKCAFAALARRSTLMQSRRSPSA